VRQQHRPAEVRRARTGPGLRWGEATALRVCDIDFRPPPHRCPARLLRCRRPGRPRHPEIAPVPDRPAPSVCRRRAGGGPQRQAPRRARVHHARRQRHAAVQLAARHVQARPHSCRSQRSFPDSRPEAYCRLPVQAGYPPKMLQEIMGHASITTTLATCTGTCIPERWTATLTGSMRRPPKVMRPKCGQTRTPTKPIRRSQRAELGRLWRARRDSNPQPSDP